MMPLDISRLRLRVIGTETVTYRARLSDGKLGAPVVVLRAKRRTPTLDDVTTAGLLGKAACVWHLWAAELGGFKPKIDDKITDANGDDWLIKTVETHSLGNRFRLTCVQTRA